MSTSEIAKLESRWRENRQGLTFAPLAEAYRKMKEPQRALEILGEGLELHPEYIPASIVLGRCHLDLGDDAAAETAFVRVLGLDTENVIALKALAEITERHGRFDEAESWLRQLLAIDRSNDEARAQLARVDESRRRGPPESETQVWAPVANDEPFADVATSADGELTPEPVAQGRVEGLTPAVDTGDLEPEPEPVPKPQPESESELQPEADAAVESEPVSEPAAPVAGGLNVDHFEVTGLTPAEDRSATGLEIEHEEDAAPPAVNLEVRAAGQSEFQISSDADDLGITALEARSQASDYQSPDAASDLASTLSAPATGSEFQSADAAADLAGTYDFDAPLDGEAVETESGLAADSADSGDEADVQPLGASLGAYAAWSEPIAEREWAAIEEAGRAPAPTDDTAGRSGGSAAAEESVPLHAVSAAGPDEAGPDEAEPEEAEPEEAEPDLVVTESMAELYRRQGHHAEALTIYRELYLRHPDDLRLREKLDQLETAEAAVESGEAQATGYSAAQTGGQSVASLFGTLLAGRLAPVTPRGNPRAPAVDAPAAGAPTSASGSGEPTRPADDRLSLSSVFGDETSPVPPAVPGGAAATPDGISFDDFFDGPAPAEPTTRRAPAREDDDLDQFHAWLQNLKR